MGLLAGDKGGEESGEEGKDRRLFVPFCGVLMFSFSILLLSAFLRAESSRRRLSNSESMYYIEV